MTRHIPIWSRTAALTTTPSVIKLPDGWTKLEVAVDARCYAQIGQSYTAPGVASVNGVTTISSGGGATGGTFQILVFPRPMFVDDGGTGYAQTVNGIGCQAVTAAIPFNETAANIKTALLNTNFFATGDITAAGGALPTDVTLTWTGVYAGIVPKLDIASAVTGGANARIYQRTTTNATGNGGYGYAETAVPTYYDGSQAGHRTGLFLYLAAVASTANAFITALG